MTFEQWEQNVPACIREDSLWRMRAYQLALFLSDIALKDAGQLLRKPLYRSVAEQLTRASSNISSSIAEGYSRGTGKGRAVFYQYALGSARETRDWYYKCSGAMKAEVRDHRLSIATETVKLLVRMISSERRLNNRLQVGVAVTE